DLLSIWRWGATHFSPQTADTHLRDIQRAAAHLSEFPEAGAARDQIVPGIRSIVVYPTVLFYRIGNASIDIVRVIVRRLLWNNQIRLVTEELVRARLPKRRHQLRSVRLDLGRDNFDRSLDDI